MSLTQNLVAQDYPSTDKEDSDFNDELQSSESGDETSDEASDGLSDDDLVPSTPTRGQQGLIFQFSQDLIEKKELTSYLSCRWTF